MLTVPGRSKTSLLRVYETTFHILCERCVMHDE
jgi:hypothetical protein